MKRISAFYGAAAVALSLFISAAAQEPAKDSALSMLIEAERNFARASVMNGRNSAFVENLAEECLVFSKAWMTKGRQFFKEQKKSPIVLKWEPEFADISESRDFGVTTGPWEVQEYRPNTAPLMKGYFLTVWQKQTDGVWKAILDNGAIMQVPENPDHSVSFPEGADKPAKEFKPADVAVVSAELKETDKRFLAEWKKTPVPATYLTNIAPGARVMRTGALPATNKEAVDAMIASEDSLATWACAGSGASASGDLGFTYGIFSRGSEDKFAEGSYVRIWKKQPGGKWKIMIEMVSFD